MSDTIKQRIRCRQNDTYDSGNGPSPHLMLETISEYPHGTKIKQCHIYTAEDIAVYIELLLKAIFELGAEYATPTVDLMVRMADTMLAEEHAKRRPQ